MNRTLAKWIEELKREFLLSEEQDAQANDNLHSFTLPNDAKIGVEDIETFIKDAASLVLSKSKNIKFYCWFDEMAGQLRFSAINKAVKDLPFSCTYAIAKTHQVAMEAKVGESTLHGKGYLNVYIAE